MLGLSSTFPSYTSVFMICDTSSSPRGTLQIRFICMKSSTCPSVASPFFWTYLRHASCRPWMKPESNSFSVNHAPPVISLAGSRSYSMYTLRFFCCFTAFTAFTSFLCSSPFRILVICGCCRLECSFRSFTQIPLSSLPLMSWYTSSSSALRVWVLVAAWRSSPFRARTQVAAPDLTSCTEPCFSSLLSTMLRSCVLSGPSDGTVP
mmetsp:Transcript_31107/g.87191  ORF Transcript_31107/g.87191 Transcript_31107/m.87191 type:complete len:206 (-) Transcript_31107:52-669(-)